MDRNLCEIRKSTIFGRYVVAKENIPEGTLLLKEHPLVFAPADELLSEDSKKFLIFCIACGLHLQTNNYNSLNSSEKCSRCLWPLCGGCNKRCLTAHSELECELLQSKRFPPPHQWPVLHKSLFVLRIVILLDMKPDLWESFFTHLEHHNNVRNLMDHCVKNDEMILDNIKYFLQNDESFTSKLNIDERRIREIIGIINVNSFCASKGTEKHEVYRKYKNLFQDASLFAHSCSPNCFWKIDMVESGSKNFIPQIRVVSSVSIPKSGLITIAYNTRHLFYGTLKRQILIESVAHFTCKCDRCCDPTELSSFMSALHCLECDSGYLISEDPARQCSHWKCNQESCGQKITVEKTVRLITGIEDLVDAVEEQDLDAEKKVDLYLDIFNKNCGMLMHENHYVLQEISTKILELMIENLENVSDEKLEIFLAHCRKLKTVADIILPGINAYQDQLKDYEEEAIYIKSLRT